ncbi:hypothetical protein B0O99DRAFT_694603 [Bisporella sp. PMI_857]|nr:hypothetical protein B0O99DRAFT_694603 [Bisporella sp. PMI_857]
MSRYFDFKTSDHIHPSVVQDETAYSRLFQIIDCWSVESPYTSTNTMSQKLLLVLLQSAARLYESISCRKEATDLIESMNTRAILSLCAQEVVSMFVYEDSSGSNEDQNYAGLLSIEMKRRACQLNYQAITLDHISSLCHMHITALQRKPDVPEIEEQLLLRNCNILCETLSQYEKSWLAILFPSIFQLPVSIYENKTHRVYHEISQITEELDPLVNKNLAILTSQVRQIQRWMQVLENNAVEHCGLIKVNPFTFLFDVTRIFESRPFEQDSKAYKEEHPSPSDTDIDWSEIGSDNSQCVFAFSPDTRQPSAASPDKEEYSQGSIKDSCHWAERVEFKSWTVDSNKPNLSPIHEDSQEG